MYYENELKRGKRMRIRLNQFISTSGFCSRRHADQLLKENRVMVNGITATLGAMIDQDDQVEIDGQLIMAKENIIYLMLNKPPGITCTAASHIEGNIIEYVNYPERIFPVGRLDKQSTGLILLTDDGSILNDLLREENNQEKDYHVTVDREITPDFIKKMSSGVSIYNPRIKGHSITKPCEVVQIDRYRFKITLSQGLNRQIRRMCRRFQYTVTELQRVRIKHLDLGELELGHWRELTEDEIHGLKQ